VASSILVVLTLAEQRGARQEIRLAMEWPFRVGRKALFTLAMPSPPERVIVRFPAMLCRTDER